MSSTLYWRRATPVPPDDGHAKQPLKGILAQRLWDPDADGSLCYEEREIGTEEIPFLEGLVAAGINEAGELLASLREHGRLVVWIQG